MSRLIIVSAIVEHATINRPNIASKLIIQEDSSNFSAKCSEFFEATETDGWRITQTLFTVVDQTIVDDIVKQFAQ